MKQSRIINLLLVIAVTLSVPIYFSATADDSLGKIYTVAGNGYLGSSGDGGPAIQATIYYPRSISLGPDGSFYVAEYGSHRIRQVDPDGIITTVAGKGTAGFSGDSGPATDAELNKPANAVVAPDGSLYIVDTGNHRIRRVGLDSIITTVAGDGVQGFGGDGGPATHAQINTPSDLAIGADGSLYIADGGNYRIRRVAPDGIIETVAGNGTSGFNGDGLPAMQTQLTPYSVALGADGSFYVTDYYNRLIRQIGTDGIVTTVANLVNLISPFWPPYDLTLDTDGNIYVAADHRILRVDTNGAITTVAGTGEQGFGGDGGWAIRARLDAPAGVAVAADGGLYIADFSNHRIRRVGLFVPGTGSNQPPVADAGAAINTLLCSGNTVEVVLNGSGSTDPDGDVLAYTWTGPFGTASGEIVTVALGAGIHQVTLTVNDGKGHSASDTVQVTATKDNVPPMVSAGEDVTLALTGFAGTPYQLQYSANDNCGPVTVTVSPAPVAYPVGSTVVTVTAVDGQGNSASDSIVVTVIDDGGPTLGLPDTLELEATSGNGAQFTIPNYVYDVCGCVHVYYEPALETLGIGTHAVTIVAIDGGGNEIRRTVWVVVKDSTAPTLVVPPTLTLEGTGVFTRVNLTYEAYDLYGVTVTNDAPEGGFPVGSTVVTWTAVDANGNSTIATQTVTITDTTAPVLALPPRLTLEATGTGGVILSTSAFAGYVSDLCGEVTLTFSANQCGFGETPVIVTACDEYSNCTSSTVTVIVRDTIAPTIIFDEGSGGGTVYVEATGPTMAVTLPAPTVIDLSTYTLTNNARAMFDKSETLVTWTATDKWGNASTAIQTVIVRDTSPPLLELPSSLFLEATSAHGVPVDISNCQYVVSDVCGCGEVKVRVVTEEEFCALGTHPVIIEACDQDGNCTQGSMEVTVKDTTAPTVKLTTFEDKLWPPNHKLVKVAEVTDVFDAVDTDPRIHIIVASNEPLNGEGDGNTDFDWKIVRNGSVWEVWLRSERAGTLDGRYYTIGVTVTDDSGNTTEVEGVVSVPHDMRDKNGGGKGKK